MAERNCAIFHLELSWAEEAFSMLEHPLEPQFDILRLTLEGYSKQGRAGARRIIIRLRTPVY